MYKKLAANLAWRGFHPDELLVQLCLEQGLKSP